MNVATMHFSLESRGTFRARATAPYKEHLIWIAEDEAVRPE